MLREARIVRLPLLRAKLLSLFHEPHQPKSESLIG